MLLPDSGRVLSADRPLAALPASSPAVRTATSTCRSPASRLPQSSCCQDACAHPGHTKWPGVPGLPALQHTADYQDVRGGHHHGPSEAAEEGTCSPGRPLPTKVISGPECVREDQVPLAVLWDGSSVALSFSRARTFLSSVLKAFTHSLCHQVSSWHDYTNAAELLRHQSSGGARQRKALCDLAASGHRSSDILGGVGTGETRPRRALSGNSQLAGQVTYKPIAASRGRVSAGLYGALREEFPRPVRVPKPKQ